MPTPTHAVPAAALLPSVLGTSAAASPFPASADLVAPTFVGVSGAASPLRIAPGSKLDQASHRTHPAASLLGTTQTSDVPNDSGPPDAGSTRRYTYLEYNQEEFIKNLEQLVDPSRWAGDCKKMRKVIVKWHKSFKKHDQPVPVFLEEVAVFFADLTANGAASHQGLVRFLHNLRNRNRDPTLYHYYHSDGSSHVGHRIGNEAPLAALQVEGVPVAITPAEGETRVHTPPLKPVVSQSRVPTHPPVAGPSGLSTRQPSHLPPDAVPKRSTRTTSRAQAQKHNVTSGKGKVRYVNISSGDEEDEEDELESEEDMDERPIKKEPDPDYTTRSGAKRSRRRKPKAEPKASALVQESDDDEGPTVIDRFAVAGENDPACSYCADHQVPCEFVVDEWITQCKLCQSRRVGCSVSPAKVFALKTSGRKRFRQFQGNATVKKDPSAAKVPRATPAARNSNMKKSGLGIGSQPNIYDLGVAEMLAELRPLPASVDQLSNGIQDTRTELRELRTALDSLVAGMTQRSDRLMENQALFISEISAMLRDTGLPLSKLSPGMYLGGVPNPLAISKEDLAKKFPGHLIDKPQDTASEPSTNPSAQVPDIVEPPEEPSQVHVEPMGQSSTQDGTGGPTVIAPLPVSLRSSKRAQPSSIVSTRRSKRRRGETPDGS